MILSCLSFFRRFNSLFFEFVMKMNEYIITCKVYNEMFLLMKMNFIGFTVSLLLLHMDMTTSLNHKSCVTDSLFKELVEPI